MLKARALPGFAVAFLLLLFFVSLAHSQSVGGGAGEAYMPEGCWNFYDNSTCLNETDEHDCLWREDMWGGWGGGWCEREYKELNCWEYGGNASCEGANCSWSTYGYCYQENCWDFKDRTACEQASTIYNASGLDCKWETQGTADTTDDYCYEQGCWSYWENDTCSDASAKGCSWELGGGWCSDLGCWDYDAESTCNAQGNCEWDGGANCRNLGCWDLKTNETCLNATLLANLGLDCLWNSDWNYCYEKGCWNYQDNSSHCENSSEYHPDMSCTWSSEYTYCYEPSCYDYKNSTACDAASGLDCYWDGWNCQERGCWTLQNTTSCDATDDAMDCRWKKTGWCSQYDCWGFDNNTACLNDSASYGLNCFWNDYEHCEGSYELECWTYDNQSSCTGVGCDWKLGWCYREGCWNYNDATNCTDAGVTIHPDMRCEWHTEGYCSGSEQYNCWDYDSNASCSAVAPNCTWYTYDYCREEACWNYNNQSSCASTADELTCSWSNSSKYCYKASCWELDTNETCTNLTAHPDLDCEWNSEWNHCYEAGCWNNNNESSCSSNNCKWEWGGGYCEENKTGVDCWNFNANTTCSSYDECTWDVWGYCGDTDACWKQGTQTECEGLYDTKRCVWNSEHSYCYEKGCWDYTNSSACSGVGCKWDGSNCYYEGCWKYGDNQTECDSTNDTLTCKFESYYYCQEQGCWDYEDNQSHCENASEYHPTFNCNWQTGGWCSSNGTGVDCWKYWEPSDCDIAPGCDWAENSWCEDIGPWYYNDEPSCNASGFKWKAEGGWCEEPFDLQCWNFNQTECDTNNATCMWDSKWNECMQLDCWAFSTNTTCASADPNLGCRWMEPEQVSTGWCEEVSCWTMNQSACSGSVGQDMSCTYATFGWCEEDNCWMQPNETACDAMTTRNCDWENATNFEEGWCEPVFGKWDTQCWNYGANKTNCEVDSGGDCQWRTGWCNEPGCWSYNDNQSYCENSSEYHQGLNCTWYADPYGGGFCEEVSCWNFWNASECENSTAGSALSCTWHTDAWSPDGGWCEEPGCWSYHDNASCTGAPQDCEWFKDAFGGWCQESGCWSIWDENTCGTTGGCTWRTESHCEEARCWMFDAYSGGNETACENNTMGLNCTWSDPWCDETYAGCDAFDNDMWGCFDTGFCWWDEGSQACNTPGDDWIEELEGERTNPGCWIFDYEMDYCNASYVNVCKWMNATNECKGKSADVEITCGSIKDSEFCESIPVLSTCCSWKNNKCQSDPESTKCYMNIEDPPEGAWFCEDYVAYTDEMSCENIAGEPWFMPCEWDGEHCAFRSEEKFGGEKKGCNSMTNEKDCEFAGCDWKTDFYCANETAVPFGWCGEKTGIGSKSCDAACWACEYQPNGDQWNDSSAAEKACKNSNLGYCEWINDTSAANGQGYCEMPESVKHIGDCSSDCKACEMKPEPQSACESSNAVCKWVDDNTGATTIGGWCYPKSEKSCSEDCFRCYDEKSCLDYGGGSKGSCDWDESQICKPKNFDKEICFNGEDDDGDGRLDCDDADCFSDSFCGGGVMSDCWKYDTEQTCVSEGAASNCIWVKDPWEGDEWCGVQGENCFLWDGDETGCDSQNMCEWFPAPKGGFCDLDKTKVETCFKATTQGACTINADCSWEIDSTSSTGGTCEPKLFKCKDRTTQTDCTSGEWSSRCAWLLDEFGNGVCEPICFSKDLKTQTTCDNNANCDWIGGFCDPMGGMKVEDCWKLDNNPTACGEALACEYHIDPWGGFCDINFTTNDEVCMNMNQSACDTSSICSWKGESSFSWCDLKIFECGWYQDNVTCENASEHPDINCTWIEESFGPMGGGPRCEPICFAQDQGTCGDQAPTCAWREGFCEPKMMKLMFQGMDDKPVDLGGDDDGDCGPGSGDAKIPQELDICGFGLKEMPDAIAFGLGVYSMEDAALCKGKKVVQGSPEGIKVLAESGTGTNTTKLYLYLDTDGSETGNCWLWNNPDEEGYEFFFEYKAKLENGEMKETRTAYRCANTNGGKDWVITDIKLSGWPTLMCSEIGGMMIAVDKDDMAKFSDMFKPEEEMRIYMATAGKKRTESTPSDTVGPGHYTPGTIDFRFEDCLTPGVDMDDDGFTSENDPDCFMFHKAGGFIKHEDCFETGVDEDEDGLADCDDTDCKFAPNCAGKGVNVAGYNDSAAPKLLWYEVDEYPDAAFVRYDTDEPANGTIFFYRNDSTCSGNYTEIKDPALLDAKTSNDYKNWHDGPIDNFYLNTQALGYNLTNGTEYYFKLKVCDSSGNCGTSACLSFNTSKSGSKADCPDCWAMVPTAGGACGLADEKVKVSYDQIVDIPLSVGNETPIIIEDVKSKSFDAPNVTKNDTSTSDGKNVGYVGMDSDDFDKMRSKLGTYTEINCTIQVPKGTDGDCAKLWHCPDPNGGTIDMSKCEDKSSEATLLSDNSTYCEWRVPCEFSVWASNPVPDDGGDGGDGGGGGAAVSPAVNVTEEPENVTEEVPAENVTEAPAEEAPAEEAPAEAPQKPIPFLLIAGIVIALAAVIVLTRKKTQALAPSY